MTPNPNEVLKNAQQAKGGPAELKEGKESPTGEKKGIFSRFSSAKCLVAGLALTAAVAGAQACADDKTDEVPPVPDAAVDAGPDTDSQTDSDTSTDTGTETDTGTDTGTETDTGTDTGTDSDLDAGTDSGPDVDSGTDTDSGTPLVCEEATDATFNSVINSGTPMPVGALEVEYNGGTDATGMLLSITCGADSVADQVFPIGVKTTLPLAGGKVVDVTPNHCAPTWGHVTVDVHNPL